MEALKLFEGVDYSLICGELDCEVTDIVEDSRKVTRGAVFICRRGSQTDGHCYIDEAMSRGVAGVVLTGGMESPDAAAWNASEDIPKCHQAFVVGISEYRAGVGRICNNFWGWPSLRLVVIGITGTKGKTTTACMIHSIINAWGKRAGLIGTIETDDGAERQPSVNTTPDVVYIHRKLADMVRNGLSYCVMEVSSQGLMKGRVSGVRFDIAVYTNISPDHIGACEHKSFEEYVRWKSSLFGLCRLAVVNIDDSYVSCMTAEAVAAGASVVSYGMRRHTGEPFCHSCMAQNLRLADSHEAAGMSYELCTSGGCEHITVGLPGIFNVYNSLAAIAVCDVIGVPYGVMKGALESICVRGRTERVTASGGVRVYIDYAHNAVSLENVLLMLRQYTEGRLLCLFGCGGNRPGMRRIQMGRVSGLLADMTIITSDNPRSENPLDIMTDIELGVKLSGGSYVMIQDRTEAIRYGLGIASQGDILLLAGKGHEQYQEVCGRRIHMNERELIREMMEEDDAGTICRCDN